MKFEKDPTLKEFMDAIQSYSMECMSKDGNIKSHTFPASISIYNEEDNIFYDIVGINIDHMGGCGCEQGIEITIKKS